MRHRSIPSLLFLAALLPAALVPAVRAMQEEDGRHDPGVATPGPAPNAGERDAAEPRRVRHRFVFVDEDGSVHEASGDGDDFAWVAVTGPHGDLRLHGRRLGALAHLASGGFLGVGTVPMTPELRRHFGAPEDAGVLISEIVEDSPAFEAGLRVGDILSAVDGEPIRDGVDLLRRIRSHREGDAVSLDLIRDGSSEQVVAVLEQISTNGDRNLSWLYRFDCTDSGDNCDERVLDLCPGTGGCEVRIECDGGTCHCEADGATVECDRLEGIDLPHHD